MRVTIYFLRDTILMSLSSRIVNFYLSHDGRKRRYSDATYFEKHIEELRKVNSLPYILPEKWDFGVPMRRTDFKGHACYILNEGKEKALLYLHGGSAIHQLLKYHYKFLKKILKSIDITVYLPIYPLAPVYTCRDCYPMLNSVYDLMLENHRASDITVMGDSMGGNLALAFPKTLVGMKDMCGSIILLSPWLDMAGDHPRTADYFEREPRLSPYELKRCAELWAGGTDLHDPIVSPIYGTLDGLPKISVYVGTEEVLLLDSERLRDKAMEEGHELDFHLWKGMSHVFPVQPIREAKMVFPEIIGDFA